jgi:hypothetical protein
MTPERIIIDYGYAGGSDWARVRGEHPDNTYRGTSPDEALGALLRDGLLCSGRLPIVIVDINKIEEDPHGHHQQTAR